MDLVGVGRLHLEKCVATSANWDVELFFLVLQAFVGDTIWQIP